MLKFLILFLLITNFAEASDYQYNILVNQTFIEKNLQNNLESIKLSEKIQQLKQKYNLKFKDSEDCLETCKIVIYYEPFNKKFDRYDMSALIIQESKFNKNALDKKDKSKGLTQIIKKYWKDEFPWYENEYDKFQSIKASYSILDNLQNRYKNKFIAIKRYNGSKSQSVLYAKNVYKIKTEIIKIQ